MTHDHLMALHATGRWKLEEGVLSPAVKDLQGFSLLDDKRRPTAAGDRVRNESLRQANLLLATL